MNERLRIMLNRPPGDKMDDIDIHTLTWGILMTSTVNAAVFPGQDHAQNLHSTRNAHERPTVKKLFDVTQKLNQEQRLEISGVSEISSATSPCERPFFGE